MSLQATEVVLAPLNQLRLAACPGFLENRLQALSGGIDGDSLTLSEFAECMTVRNAGVNFPEKAFFRESFKGLRGIEWVNPEPNPLERIEIAEYSRIVCRVKVVSFFG